jgi:hypothetical protein
MPKMPKTFKLERIIEIPSNFHLFRWEISSGKHLRLQACIPFFWGSQERFVLLFNSFPPEYKLSYKWHIHLSKQILWYWGSNLKLLCRPGKHGATSTVHISKYSILKILSYFCLPRWGDNYLTNKTTYYVSDTM